MDYPIQEVGIGEKQEDEVQHIKNFLKKKNIRRFLLIGQDHNNKYHAIACGFYCTDVQDAAMQFIVKAAQSK